MNFCGKDVCHCSQGKATPLNKEFRSDIAWWHTFIHCWNGQSMLRSTKPHSYRFAIHTDASGSWGDRAFMSGQWLQWEWLREWVPQGIMAKELVPIVLSCIVWGPQLTKQPVLILCDNLSLINAITKDHQRTLWLCSFCEAYGSLPPILTSSWQLTIYQEYVTLQPTNCQETR